MSFFKNKTNKKKETTKLQENELPSDPPNSSASHLRTYSSLQILSAVLCNVHEYLQPWGKEIKKKIYIYIDRYLCILQFLKVLCKVINDCFLKIIKQWHYNMKSESLRAVVLDPESRAIATRRTRALCVSSSPFQAFPLAHSGHFLTSLGKAVI